MTTGKTKAYSGYIIKKRACKRPKVDVIMQDRRLYWSSLIFDIWYGCWGAAGGPFKAGRAVTGPQPMLPPTDGRPAHAPSAQSGGIYTSSLSGDPHWASFCKRKSPPHKQWPLPRATLTWLVTAGPQEPPVPTSLSDVSPVPFQPAFPGRGQGSIVSSHPGPSSSGPGQLRCLASCVVPEPKMHRHSLIYCR